MKWMIASDLHGSAYYTRLLLEAMDREQPDRLLLLGDLLYHGPRNDLPRDYAPKEVIALLNPLAGRVFCVRGNCEAEVDQMVLEFPVLADYCLIPAGKRMLYVTHGHVWPADRPHPYSQVRRPRVLRVSEPRLRVHSQGRQLARLYDLG